MKEELTKYLVHEGEILHPYTFMKHNHSKLVEPKQHNIDWCFGRTLFSMNFYMLHFLVY